PRPSTRRIGGIHSTAISRGRFASTGSNRKVGVIAPSHPAGAPFPSPAPGSSPVKPAGGPFRPQRSTAFGTGGTGALHGRADRLGQRDRVLLRGGAPQGQPQAAERGVGVGAHGQQDVARLGDPGRAG